MRGVGSVVTTWRKFPRRPTGRSNLGIPDRSTDYPTSSYGASGAGGMLWFRIIPYFCQNSIFGNPQIAITMRLLGFDIAHILGNCRICRSYNSASAAIGFLFSHIVPPSGVIELAEDGPREFWGVQSIFPPFPFEGDCLIVGLKSDDSTYRKWPQFSVPFI